MHLALRRKIPKTKDMGNGKAGSGSGTYSTRKTIASALVLAAIFVASFGANKQPKKKIQDPDLAYREYMLEISRQLGVTCNYCHDVSNFKKSNMAKYKIALEHIKIVSWLNKEGFKSSRNVKADCYMCHYGKAKPDYKEKLRIGHD